MSKALFSIAIGTTNQKEKVVAGTLSSDWLA